MARVEGLFRTTGACRFHCPEAEQGERG